MTEKESNNDADVAANNKNKMIIRMSDYSYDLQESSIARYPANPRGSSKLLRWTGRGDAQYWDHFANHFASLAANSHVLFNDSRVLDARLFVQAGTELMLLDLGSVDVASTPCHSLQLRAMLRTTDASIQAGVELVEDKTGVKVKVVSVQGIWEEDEKSDGNGLDCFVTIQSEHSLQQFLEEAGSVPIPPYFRRGAEESDAKAYNNVYAAQNGSVAAPTAGLHFTPALLEQLGRDNTLFLTLHVGAGTFQPVLKQNAAEHDMHAESFVVSTAELERIAQILVQKKEKPLIVVGTTSCRTLESLYWCGVKLLLQLEDGSNTSSTVFNVSEMELGQFEWQSLAAQLASSSRHIPAHQALQALVQQASADSNATNNLIRGRTRLMITPESYQFKVVEHLVTNFHAPDSTLMLLVSAFVGNAATIRDLYHQAQDRGYQFLSYGDVCLFSRPGCLLPVDRMEEQEAKAEEEKE